MMTWVWLIAGIILLMIGAVFTVGALLPRDHVATRSVWLKQPASEIWKIIREVKSLPQWRSGVTQVDGLTGEAVSPSGWVEHSGKDQLKIVVASEQTPNQLVTRIDDDQLPFGGTWTYDLSETNGGTLLRITEAGFVKPAPFRFIARFLIGHTKTMEGYLKDLAAKTANDVRIEP